MNKIAKFVGANPIKSGIIVVVMYMTIMMSYCAYFVEQPYQINISSDDYFKEMCSTYKNVEDIPDECFRHHYKIILKEKANEERGKSIALTVIIPSMFPFGILLAFIADAYTKYTYGYHKEQE